MPYKIYISAGETSGDIHGAGLAGALFKNRSDIEISGMGGTYMKNAGVEIIRDCRDYTVLGFTGVISNLFKFKKLLNDVTAFIRDSKVDLVVLIDYSGFNLRLARAIEPLGVKIVYFVSPQVWAWRTGRVQAIRKYVHRMITIFPFETEFYRKFGVDVDYVGHPMLDGFPEINSVERRKIAEQFLKPMGLNPEDPVLGLFPGSREQELDRMFSIMLRTAGLLKKEIPNLNVLVAFAPGLDYEKYETRPEFITIKPVVDEGKARDILYSSNAVLISSGTTTVEAALCGTPQVVMYKTSYLTYIIARLMVRVDYIAMANLIVGKRVVPEFIQNEAVPASLKDELYPLLTEQEYTARAQEIAKEIRIKLGQPGAYERAANVVIDTLKKVVDDDGK